MTADALPGLVESRLRDDPDLAQTLAARPRVTIEGAQALGGGKAALEALRSLSGPLDAKVTLHRTLGEGGMGIVHLATQASLGRHVAVKTLRAGLDNLDATLRILREAWVNGALEHPNIVPIYDVGVDAEGSPVIVMKRVEGPSWYDVMRDAPALSRLFDAADPVEANVRILIAVCNAIHFAHSRGILHRDIKPDNVMIGSFGEVYVLDWGIAVSLRDDRSGRLPLASDAREPCGTPCYMAPEMVLGDPSALSPRSDVYLLGAVLYEVFAGAPPHVGGTPVEMMSRILLSEPPFPDDFPHEARSLCQKAMQRDPAARYESAEAFRIALEGYLRHRGSRKLAWDAKRSLSALERTLADQPPGEERTLAVFNLLGECRFGYRAALSAWPGNTAAQRGLDNALVAVIDHQLAESDPHAAATLLREVTAPPDGLTARVEAALRARTADNERLRKLEQSLDPKIGSRTRTVIGSAFGLLWVATPLIEWAREARGHVLTHAELIGSSAAYFAVGAVIFAWARDTMTKTLVNRRLVATFAVHFSAQTVLAAGGWLAGTPPLRTHASYLLVWTLSHAMLAVWVEPWLSVSAATCAAAFLVTSARPEWTYPLMSLCIVVFTVVIVRVWLPRQDVAFLRRQRRNLGRATRTFLATRGRGGTSDEVNEGEER